MFGLICFILFLAVVAVVVQYMKLPEPYAKVIQLILLVVLLVGVAKYLFGGAGGPAFNF